MHYISIKMSWNLHECLRTFSYFCINFHTNALLSRNIWILRHVDLVICGVCILYSWTHTGGYRLNVDNEIAWSNIFTRHYKFCFFQYFSDCTSVSTKSSYWNRDSFPTILMNTQTRDWVDKRVHMLIDKCINMLSPIPGVKLVRLLH